MNHRADADNGALGYSAMMARMDQMAALCDNVISRKRQTTFQGAASGTAAATRQLTSRHDGGRLEMASMHASHPLASCNSKLMSLIGAASRFGRLKRRGRAYSF